MNPEDPGDPGDPEDPGESAEALGALLPLLSVRVCYSAVRGELQLLGRYIFGTMEAG